MSLPTARKQENLGYLKIAVRPQTYAKRRLDVLPTTMTMIWKALRMPAWIYKSLRSFPKLCLRLLRESRALCVNLTLNRKNKSANAACSVISQACPSSNPCCKGGLCENLCKISPKIFTAIVDNYHNDSVAVTRINLDLDRVSLDAIDGGGTDLGQHGVNCHRRVAGVQARDLRSGWRSQCPP